MLLASRDNTLVYIKHLPCKCELQCLFWHPPTSYMKFIAFWQPSPLERKGSDKVNPMSAV